MEEENNNIKPEKSENNQKKSKEHFTHKLRKNPWIVSALVLGVLVLILLIVNFSGGMTGNVISSTDAGDAILNFVKIQTNGQGELVEVNSFADNFYEVIILYQEQEVPLYLTKDGEYLIQGLTPLSVFEEESGGEIEEETDQADVPKSDKPEVELFIWSYCPYGVIAQGPLAEVASLLGNKANFKAVLYYDGHGAYETQQNKIQACIQEVDKDKYWDYAAGFVEDIYPVCGASRDIDCDKTESINLMTSLGIDSSAVMSCVDSRGESLIGADSQYAQQLGVTGSPTLIVNGVKMSVARTAEAYKTAVCGAFNEVPEECDEVLERNTNSASTSAQC